VIRRGRGRSTSGGYRAVHETAQTGQAVVAAFCGQRPNHSYFNGCSNGGRQAPMEAQRYPADYDGIIAGSPANFMTHLFSSGVWDNQVLTSNPTGYPSPSKLPAIEAAALAKCDGLDGVVDGVIDDPRRCDFDPSHSSGTRQPGPAREPPCPAQAALAAPACRPALRAE
jgi:feruloyl esterase